VVILSGSEAESDMNSSYNLHANLYVIKPENFDDYKEIDNSIENYWIGKSEPQAQNKTLH
jgi:hypothetical protein